MGKMARCFVFGIVALFMSVALALLEAQRKSGSPKQEAAGHAPEQQEATSVIRINPNLPPFVFRLVPDPAASANDHMPHHVGRIEVSKTGSTGPLQVIIMNQARTPAKKSAREFARQARLILAVVCSIALLYWNLPGTVRADDGNLDPSFGYSQNGRVNIDFAGGDDVAYAIVLQSDDKILAGGYACSSEGYSDFGLARFTPNGTLDPSFGTEGRITTNFLDDPDCVFGLALQPDGKVVAAGYATSQSGKDFAVARYHSDGRLDTAFGSNGKVNTDFFGRDDLGLDVAITPSGRILAAGFATTSENQVFAVVCYHAFAVSPQITGILE